MGLLQLCHTGVQESLSMVEKELHFLKIQRLIVMMNDSPGSMITVERFGGGHRLDMKYSYPKNRVTRTGKQGK